MSIVITSEFHSDIMYEVEWYNLCLKLIWKGGSEILWVLNDVYIKESYLFFSM